MNLKNKINAIKVVLGLEVALASAKLMDGTVVEAESFELGFPLFIVNEDGTKSPAPTGEHTLEDGTKVVVDEMGAIAEMEKPEEAEASEVEVSIEAAEVPVEEPAKEEVAVEVKDDMKESMKKLAMIVEEMAKDMGDMKSKMKMMEEKYEKFSATPGATKFPTVTREAFDANNPLEAKIALLNELKKESFFKVK